MTDSKLFSQYTRIVYKFIELYFFFNNKLSSDRSLYFFSGSGVCFEQQGLTEITGLWGSECSVTTFRHLFQT